MRHAVKYSAVALLTALAACYHATITTGLAPSPTVIDKPWAASWIDGLVPPSTVETQAQCKSGVSKVETQHSFLNLLVGAITFGIYTPMSIKVTCAQGGHAAIPSGAQEIQIGVSATPQQVQDAWNRAATSALVSGVPVYVQH
jgi:hypothetical protein